MESRAPNGRDRRESEKGRPSGCSGYGKPDHSGGGFGREGQTYRDPCTGEPQNWQRTPPEAGSPAPDEDRAFSILSYIGILWLVGLLADRKSPEVMFHVNQGIILSIFEFALTFSLAVLQAVLRFVFGFASSGIGVLSWLGNAICGFLSFACWCLVIVYIVIGVMHAVQGRKEPLPLIGSLFTVVH